MQTNLPDQEWNQEINLDEVNHLKEREIVNCLDVPLEDLNQDWEDKIKVKKNQDDSECFGGILLTNDRGDIVFKNTLDTRCELCFEESLPEIRSMMFGN